MPQVYGTVVWTGFCLSILIPIVVFVIAHKRMRTSLLVKIAILVLGISACTAAGTFSSFFIADELQFDVAIPYIQNALHDQCPNKHLTADRSGFQISSTIDWISKKDNTVCFFSNVEWKCDCDN